MISLLLVISPVVFAACWALVLYTGMAERHEWATVPAAIVGVAAAVYVIVVAALLLLDVVDFDLPFKIVRN